MDLRASESAAAAPPRPPASTEDPRDLAVFRRYDIEPKVKTGPTVVCEDKALASLIEKEVAALALLAKVDPERVVVVSSRADAAIDADAVQLVVADGLEVFLPQADLEKDVGEEPRGTPFCIFFARGVGAGVVLNISSEILARSESGLGVTAQARSSTASRARSRSWPRTLGVWKAASGTRASPTRRRRRSWRRRARRSRRSSSRDPCSTRASRI